MSGRPALDPRRAKALTRELERRAVATLAGDGQTMPVGRVATAMLGIAARIGEEVTQRLDAVPAKQEDNFFTAMGLGRDPARPARVPVAFKLADPAPADTAAPRGTRLAAETEGPPVMFETERGIVLAPGAISALAAVDTAADAIFLSPGGVAGGALPRTAPPRRSVRGGAAAGASQLQVSPASNLEAGTVLSLGTGEAARQYRVTAIEGELITVEPPLDAALASGDRAVEVTDFAPFDGASRNRQYHALYLGHETLLDVPSALSITVAGAALPAATTWSWWGKTGEEDPAAWQPLERTDVNGRLQLEKKKGKPVPRDIGGKTSLWLRAELPGISTGSVEARDIRIAIADAGLCQTRHEDRCQPPGPMSVEFEAVANTTAIVPNSPFHPFGREPRLFDSFYIGCAEAFSKKHAEISLCIELGGPKLGPLAGIAQGGVLQVFGVGTDGILYRGKFSVGGAQFLPLPPPRQGTGGLRRQGSVAAHRTREIVDVAVAGTGEVQLATFPADSQLDPASVQWARLPAEAEDAGKPVDQVAIQTEGGIGVVYARMGSRLLSWAQTGDMFDCRVDDAATAALSELAGTDSLVAVGVEAAGKRILSLKRPGDAWAPFATVDAADVPSRGFVAWAPAVSAAPAELVLAGYDGPDDTPQVRIVRVTSGPPVAVEQLGLFAAADELPLAFELAGVAPAAGGGPTIVAASDSPRRYLWQTAAYAEAGEPQAIGPSDNTNRQFVHGGGLAAVQASEFGLLYRPLSEEFLARVDRPWLMAKGGDVPDTARFAVFASSPRGTGFALMPDTGRRLLLDVPAGQPGATPSGNAQFFRPVAGSTGTVTSLSKCRIGLINLTVGQDVDVALFLVNGVDGFPDAGIWHLKAAKSTTGLKWYKPPNLPDATGGNLRYLLLARETDEANVAIDRPLPLTEVAQVSNGISLVAALAGGPRASPYDPAATVGEMTQVGPFAVIVFPHALLEPNPAGVPPLSARLATIAQGWKAVGPSQPANPALSWEYWNGQSWWALGAGALKDRTANLLFGGGVFFEAPADMVETEVAGRTNYWIRARLSGGDYGEAKVTSVAHLDSATGDTTQTIERDNSGVRAPYVTSLKVGFCARDLVAPEIVLTEDNLGIVDRTGANAAGMPIPVFTSAAELMNPLPPTAAAGAGDSDECDEACPPPPAETAEPDPCDEPGAADRCDSPCVGGVGSHGGSTGETVAAAFTRGLLIGFDKAFLGDPVALYADVEPGALPARIRADMLRNGRYEPVEIVKDKSYGLSEPGTILLAFPRRPDEVELAGGPAHWLRIIPAAGDSAWAPRLRGLYLNAVEALSIETRTLESLGHSSGSLDQAFRLSRTPIQAESLVLRVREDVSDEEAEKPGFDVVPAAEEMPGPWVRWRLTEDLAQEPPEARAFALDPQTGVVRFGDGRNGAIPPLGSEILAVSFAFVGGAGGNSVPAGGTLQLVSPLAGVEKVIALDAAAGGSDVEAPEDARRRAPAKLRHGRHILTLADLEDFAAAFSPMVAQARAQCRGAAARLIVAARAADPRPAPALLRALARAVTENGAYGFSRGGGFTAVPPALLPIAVDLLLDPDDPEDFPELAKAAKDALGALFDPAHGGLDRAGWRLGVLPTAHDLSSALEPVAARANIARIALWRIDGEEEAALPKGVGEHVLVTLAAADVRVDRVRETAS